MRIDDVEGILRPSFVENIPIPILKTDGVENDGCPFAGYDKKHRESRKKNAKKVRIRKLISKTHKILTVYFDNFELKTLVIL